MLLDFPVPFTALDLLHTNPYHYFSAVGDLGVIVEVSGVLPCNTNTMFLNGY